MYGVYVHAPWCRVRCPYCAFYKRVDEKPNFQKWCDTVISEWSKRAPAFPGEAHSLYFGGGTPSLVPPQFVERIIQTIPLSNKAEVTIETNPGTVDLHDLQHMKEIGVNRLSIGVQTFQPHLAHQLNRGHTALQSRKLLEKLPQLDLASWSIDLIFALPGQTLQDLTRDLQLIRDLNPPHVSLYGLTFEPNTPFFHALQKGQLREIDEELWWQQYQLIVQELSKGGWHRYEVSNFAKPGHRGRHNEAVWRGGSYCGLGPSSHGFAPGGTRTQNHPSLELWYSDPLGVTETPSPPEAARDLVLSSLRHENGLSLDLLKHRSGHLVDTAQLHPLFSSAYLKIENDHLRLEHAGWPLADGIARKVIEALSPIAVA